MWRNAVNLVRDIKYRLTERSIEFSHVSSCSPSELVRYFTTPDHLDDWFCDSVVDYDPKAARFCLVFGQDHFVVWQLMKVSEGSIEIKQNWMGKHEVSAQ